MTSTQLKCWFLPEEAARIYRDRLLQGNYLVIVKGNEAELAQARLLLTHWGTKEWRVYDESERMLKA